MEQVGQARNVAVFIFDGVELLDFSGPHEVFVVGSNRGKDLKVYLVAEQERPIIASGNVSINPNYSIYNCPTPDILVIPGGLGTRKEMHNETITNWIHQISDQTELVLSVCTGALLLAKANLLEGLLLTTHHRAFNELREVAPSSSKILEGVRYVDNGKIIFSAGVSAGIDAALYVLARLFGEERALATAQNMEYDWKKA